VNAFLTVIFVLIGVAVLIAIGMSFFVRRHAESEVPAEDWRRTDEIFVDPTTNRRMRVWVDPVDEARHYIPDK